MRRHQAIRPNASLQSRQSTTTRQSLRSSQVADRASAPGSPPPADDEVSAYFRTRLAPNAHRAAVWNHLCAYLQRWIPTDADVLELGAGWCDFANTITARRVVAMDLDTTVRSDSYFQLHGTMPTVS